MGLAPHSSKVEAPAAAARRVVLIYAAFAALWIVASDSVLEALIRDPSQWVHAQTVKGLLFVAVTALLLYVLVSRLLKETQDAMLEEQAAQLAGRRLQEEIIREREERLALASHCATLIEEARDIVLLIDTAGRIVEANRAAEEAYGWSGAALRGMTVRDLRTQENMGEVERQWQASASADGVLFETTHRHRDGHVFPVEVSSRTVEINGHPYRQSLIRDITERKRAEEEMKQRNEDLERFNRASVNRELDMVALKQRVNALSVELGRAPPFDLSAVHAAVAEVKP